MAAKKSGMLGLFDAAIWRFVVEYLPSYRPELLTAKDKKVGFVEELQQQLDVLKTTRLHNVIVGTTIRVIIGEKQKRETLRYILELLASEVDGMLD